MGSFPQICRQVCRYPNPKGLAVGCFMNGLYIAVSSSAIHWSIWTFHWCLLYWIYEMAIWCWFHIAYLQRCVTDFWSSISWMQRENPDDQPLWVKFVVRGDCLHRYIWLPKTPIQRGELPFYHGFVNEASQNFEWFGSSLPNKLQHPGATSWGQTVDVHHLWVEWVCSEVGFRAAWWFGATSSHLSQTQKKPTVWLALTPMKLIKHQRRS